MSVRWIGVCLGLAAGLGVTPLAAQVGPDMPGWFPFVMKGTDVAVDSPVDASFLNRGPAVSRISVNRGVFQNESGERVRFFGTNVTFSGAFPDKEDTPAIAARLAQLGFNVVRFHHLDARDIWLPNQEGIDPRKLDRLHWFVYQLQQHGIYSNINLHVSRTYPGLREMALPRTFRYGKVIDKFHEPFIEMQEAYAQDLLSPVNPYSKMPLSTDPAVAFVELNNENTLLRLGPNELNDLTEPGLRRALQELWGRWLAGRYPDVQALETSWNRGVVSLGNEMLANRAFGENLAPWVLEGRAPGVCEMTRSAEGGGSVHIEIRVPGAVPWAYQLHQHDVDLEENMSYTIGFRGRAEPPRRVSLTLRFAEPPWTILSGQHAVELTPEWQSFSVTCRVAGVRQGVRKRFSLNLGDGVGAVWLADPSLRPGSERFRAAGTGNVQEIPLPTSRTPATGWADFRRFLIDTEQHYVRRLTAMLRDRLGVRALIVDTQGSYGGYWGLYREASLSDYIDMHAYWQHPRFPGRPWDRGNWFIQNTSMVANADGGVYSRLTAYRVAGMPFSVSEYNHPAPNDYAAEMFPMLATFACRQDWDALYQFSYCNRAEYYAAETINSYFELCHHAGQLVFAPLMSMVFRLGLVPSAAETSTVVLPLKALDEALTAGLPGESMVSTERLPYAARFAARYGVRFDSRAGSAVVYPDSVPLTEDDVLMAGPPVRWVTGERPVLQAVTPAARIAVGRIGGRRLDLGDIDITLQLPPDTWACLAMVAADSLPVASSKRLLLAVVTRVENTGMQWNDERTTIGSHWGTPPVVAQAVPFTLVGPGPAPRVFALDSKGERRQLLEASPEQRGWKLVRGRETQTLWYSLERD